MDRQRPVSRGFSFSAVDICRLSVYKQYRWVLFICFCVQWKTCCTWRLESDDPVKTILPDLVLQGGSHAAGIPHKSLDVLNDKTYHNDTDFFALHESLGHGERFGSKHGIKHWCLDMPIKGTNHTWCVCNAKGHLRSDRVKDGFLFLDDFMCIPVSRLQYRHCCYRYMLYRTGRNIHAEWVWFISLFFLCQRWNGEQKSWYFWESLIEGKRLCCCHLTEFKRWDSTWW